MVSHKTDYLLKEPEQRFNNMKDSSGSYSNPTQIATKFNNFLLMLVLLWQIKSLPIKLPIESFDRSLRKVFLS